MIQRGNLLTIVFLFYFRCFFFLVLSGMMLQISFLFQLFSSPSHPSFSLFVPRRNLIDIEHDAEARKVLLGKALPRRTLERKRRAKMTKSFFHFCKFYPSLTFIETFKLPSVLLLAISRKQPARFGWRPTTTGESAPLIDKCCSGRFNNGSASRWRMSRAIMNRSVSYYF